METVRLTVGQAIVKFLDNQFVEFDGKIEKFVGGVIGIFGHGVVVGLGEALAAPGHGLTFIQAKNEQGAGHVAIGYAKQNNRRKIMAVTSSIGPGALNMVTAAGTATVNHIPALFLPGDVFADRQPDPVLQQLEVPHDYTISANDAFKPVSRYFDRITRPEQIMTALIHAMSVLTDPAQAGAVTIALPQDVQGEAYDYPVEFFEKRAHHIERRPPTMAQVSRIADLDKGCTEALYYLRRRSALFRGWSSSCRFLRKVWNTFRRDASRQRLHSMGSSLQPIRNRRYGKPCRQ